MTDVHSLRQHRYTASGSRLVIEACSFLQVLVVWLQVAVLPVGSVVVPSLMYLAWAACRRMPLTQTDLHLERRLCSLDRSALCMSELL